MTARTRVALVRSSSSYAGLDPPWGPGKAHPELTPLLGDAASLGPPNPVYAA